MIILQLLQSCFYFSQDPSLFYFLQALARHACVYSQTTYLSSKSEKFPFIIITIYPSHLTLLPNFATYPSHLTIVTNFAT